MLRLALLGCLLVLVVACRQQNVLQPPRTQATPQSSAVAASYPSLEVQAKEVTEALARKDFGRYADLTYPAMVKAEGGREGFIKAAAEDIAKAEAKGLTYLSARAEPPTQIIRDSGTLYAVVPTTMTIKDTDGTYRNYSYMIGVSGDDGQNWTFLSVGAVGRNGLEIILGPVCG
jgi:hypothetical protein